MQGPDNFQDAAVGLKGAVCKLLALTINPFTLTSYKALGSKEQSYHNTRTDRRNSERDQQTTKIISLSTCARITHRQRSLTAAGKLRVRTGSSDRKERDSDGRVVSEACACLAAVPVVGAALNAHVLRAPPIGVPSLALQRSRQLCHDRPAHRCL